MPSRKQRRRRAKERRHDYEVVYVDDEGNEVEPPPQVEQPRGRDRPRDGKPSRGKAAGGNRAVREVKPPSWQRSGKRALLFFPLFFIVFSLVNKSASVESRLVASLGYSFLFVPLTYVMDRTAYRTFLRRTGREPQPRR
jgi:hypothetical protein